MDVAVSARPRLPFTTCPRQSRTSKQVLGFSSSVSNSTSLCNHASMRGRCRGRQREYPSLSVHAMAKKSSSKGRPGQGSSPGKGQPKKDQSPAGKAASSPTKSASSSPKRGPFSPSPPSITNPSASSRDSLVLPLHEASTLLLPPSPPASEEEALLQAEACLGEALSEALRAAEPMTLRQRQALGSKGGRRSRGVAGSGARIQVEIPSRDSESASAQVALALRLLPVVSPAVRQGQSVAPPSSKESQDAGQTEAETSPSSQPPDSTPGQAAASPSSIVTIFFSSQAAAEQAAAEVCRLPQGMRGPNQTTVLCLDSSTVVPMSAERVLVVCPGPQQAQLVQAVVNSAGQRPVVLLNPGWVADTGAQAPSGAGTTESERAAQSLAQSFQVAYCFMPLAFQGLLGSSMGALLCAGPGWQKAATATSSWGPSEEDTYWVLFKEEGNKSKRVAVLRKRPDSEQLQNLLYAQMAAESPVSKSIQFVQSLFARP